MSSSPAIAQNRPASVISIAISVVESQRTSPPVKPKPESIYCVKTFRNWSMTPVLFMGSFLRGQRQNAAARLRPGVLAIGVGGCVGAERGTAGEPRIERRAVVGRDRGTAAPARKRYGAAAQRSGEQQ